MDHLQLILDSCSFDLESCSFDVSFDRLQLYLIHVLLTLIHVLYLIHATKDLEQRLTLTLRLSEEPIKQEKLRT